LTTSELEQVPALTGEETRPARRGRRWTDSLRIGNISLVYMYIAGFVLFSFWIPHLWLDGVTQKSVLNISFAVPAILAVGLMVPLLAGVFDLSIGGTMDVSSVVLASLMIYSHVSTWLAILITLALGALIGVVNGLLVAVLGVDSFIATLGTSSVLSALAVALSGNIQITGFASNFSNFSTGVIGAGVQYQVLYLAVIVIVVWYVVEHTSAGRYLQATGENQDAARLSGVRTRRYIFVSLVVSAVVAAFAGVVETAVIGAGESNLGDPYLLTAFAAAFLGATQFKQRFNVWGTVAGVWALASGVEGVTLALKSYAWLNSLFFGVALIVAVGIGRVVEINNGRIAVRRRAAATALPVTTEGLMATLGGSANGGSGDGPSTNGGSSDGPARDPDAL
jgi:ribose transport system permease protein